MTHLDDLVVKMTKSRWRESRGTSGKVCWCLRTKHPVAAGLKGDEGLAALRRVEGGKSEMTAHVLAGGWCNGDAPEGLLGVGAEHPTIGLDDAVQVAEEVVFGRSFRGDLVQAAEGVNEALLAAANCVHARTAQVLVTAGSQVAICPASTTLQKVLEDEWYVLVVDETRSKAKGLHGGVELHLHPLLDVTNDTGWSKVDGILPPGETCSKLGGVKQTGAGGRQKKATAAGEPTRSQRSLGA